MAKNYVQEGKVIPFTAGATITSGQVVVVGSLVGIAMGDVANGAVGQLAVEGVFDVPAATAEITVGAAVYWDADGDPVGGTADSGAATATSTDNTLMGHAIAAKAATAGTVRVKLGR
jgi:predicted RecA/RadA family phage recombinase